jgi:hypothetical protein
MRVTHFVACSKFPNTWSAVYTCVIDFALITLQTFLSQLFKCLVSFRNEGITPEKNHHFGDLGRCDNTITMSQEIGCKDVDWIELTPEGNEPSASFSEGFLNHRLEG